MHVERAFTHPSVLRRGGVRVPLDVVPGDHDDGDAPGVELLEDYVEDLHPEGPSGGGGGMDEGEGRRRGRGTPSEFEDGFFEEGGSDLRGVGDGGRI